MSSHWLFCWRNQWLRMGMNGLASFKPSISSEGGGGPLLTCWLLYRSSSCRPRCCRCCGGGDDWLLLREKRRVPCSSLTVPETFAPGNRASWKTLVVSLGPFSSPLMNNLTPLKRIEWSLDVQIVTVGELARFLSLFFSVLWYLFFFPLTWSDRKWSFIWFWFLGVYIYCRLPIERKICWNFHFLPFEMIDVCIICWLIRPPKSTNRITLIQLNCFGSIRIGLPLSCFSSYRETFLSLDSSDGSLNIN